MKVSGVLIAVVTLLTLLGVLMIFSTSGPQSEKLFGHQHYFIIRHVIWVLLGVVAAVIAARVDYHVWSRLAWPLLILTAVLLVAVYLPGIGVTKKGSSRWIGLGGITFQPSELAKFAVINFLAAWYSARRRTKKQWIYTLLIPGALLTSVLALILFESDFGATMLIGVTGGAMMFVGGAPMLLLIPFGALAVAGVGVLMAHNPERMSRIVAFLHPEEHAQGEGYQLLNALYAFVAGGPFGVGLGRSLQKQLYLPEAHTDFIFAIIGEELGVIASLGVLLLFVIFLVCGMRISGRAADTGGRLMAFGITLLLSVQAAVNVAVVTGCMPTKGLPLPFISFGGSSLVVTLFMVGVLLNIAGQGGYGAIRLRRKA